MFIFEKQDFGKIIITVKKINKYFTKLLFTRFRKKVAKYDYLNYN